MTGHGEEWEIEEVEVTKPVGIVISTRFLPELVDRLQGEAKRRGIPTSAIVREAVEAYLDDTLSGVAGRSELTISAHDAPVAFIAGKNSKPQTYAAQPRGELTFSPG